MLPACLALAVVFAVAFMLLASRHLHPARSERGTGVPVPPARKTGGTGQPEAQPRGEVTGPFGYDNGLQVGERP